MTEICDRKLKDAKKANLALSDSLVTTVGETKMYVIVLRVIPHFKRYKAKFYNDSKGQLVKVNLIKFKDLSHVAQLKMLHNQDFKTQKLCDYLAGQI